MLTQKRLFSSTFNCRASSARESLLFFAPTFSISQVTDFCLFLSFFASKGEKEKDRKIIHMYVYTHLSMSEAGLPLQIYFELDNGKPFLLASAQWDLAAYRYKYINI